MTSAFDPRIDARRAAWFGGVLTFVAALAPLLGWLAPLGFAPLAALGGLLALGALKAEARHLPAMAPALAMIAWAVVSIFWTPHRPERFEEWIAVKMLAEAILVWALIRAAAEADPAGRRRALFVLAWGMAGLGAVLFVEAASGAVVYQALRRLIGDPTRPDLAAKNVAQGTFVLALFCAPAALAALRVGAPKVLGLVMMGGLLAASVVFGYDAPLLAIVLAAAAGGMVMAWPRIAPRILAAGAAMFFLGAPSVVVAAQASGLYQKLEAAAPLSWSQRMGYWSHAVRWIGDHPLRGWGIDASRMFAPGIKLHPHDAALQIWLELGLVGAVCAAAFWAAVFLRMSRRAPDLGVAAGAASAVAYLVFAAVSFGVWQEWWVCLGGVVAAFAFAVERQPPASAVRRSAASVTQPSTPAPISG
ncbi:MAG: O-antigen ligase family protein [Phenylobacterium sp.]|uniref:O-antigen ligase family protein n=1 Tax=Phenylobacterium sp. TaxID=1871053 RepID=UPI0039199331